jgi:hypothetical protein
MTKHYCRNCGQNLGHIQYVDPITDFTGSVGSYKFDKYLKHISLPVVGSGTISVFNNSDYNAYKNYIIDTAISGSVEIDDMGRTNLIWFANKQTGQTYQQRQFDQFTDGVKLVLHKDDQKVHAFPTGSHGFQRAVCDNCGNSIIV